MPRPRKSPITVSVIVERETTMQPMPSKLERLAKRLTRLNHRICIENKRLELLHEQMKSIQFQLDALNEDD
jgi:hypothetical protein